MQQLCKSCWRELHPPACPCHHPAQVLLPHLAARCAYIKPSTLAGLLRAPGSLVPRLISLRQLLPGADIGQVAAAEPELLLLRDLESLQVHSLAPPRCRPQLLCQR